jgi:hypothetical protein
MVVLGLVLLLGAGVFAASAISSNTGAVGGDLWGLHISNVTVGEVFVAGLATGAVALLGLVMMFAGSRRSQRLRRERRELARENARLVQHVDSGEQRVAEAPGVPVDRNAVPVDRNGVPVDRNGAPVTDRTERLNPAREERYASPPPPSYDRASIAPDGSTADNYETTPSGEPVPGEAPRRRL